MNMTLQSKTLEAVLEIPHCVSDFVMNMGAPTNHTGFSQLCTAILLVAHDPTLSESITKRLYPEVAKKYGTTPSRVERNIRHTIEKSFERVDYQDFYDSVGYKLDPIKCKVTNSEMICLAAIKLREQILRG